MESLKDLIRGITLVYRETEIEDLTPTTKEIVKELCEKVRLPSDVDLDRTRMVMTSLKSLLMRLATQDIEKGGLDKDLLMQEIRMSCQGREDLIEIFTTGIATLDDPNKIKRQRNTIRNDLSSSLKFEESKKAVNEIFKRFRMSTAFNYGEILLEMNSVIEPILKQGISNKNSRGSQSLLLTDLVKSESMFELSRSDDNPRLYLDVGWTWLREMLGKTGKLRRGDMCGFYALQHNYKSGMVNNIARQIVQYNPGFACLDDTKKPILINLSTENHLHENMKFLFRQIKENEKAAEHAKKYKAAVERGASKDILESIAREEYKDEPCDVTKYSNAEMAKFVGDWCEEQGWEVAMLREDPSDFTYRDHIAIVEQYEAMGFEVVAYVCDYLAMCSTKGCFTGMGGGTGMDIRAMFRRLRNYMASKHILFLVPHQLSTEAKSKLEDYSPATFLENIAGKGYTDSCRTIDQEFDLEIYAHIVKAKDRKYLTTYRGKHRGVDDTPECHMKKVIPFFPVGGIQDDIGAPKSVPKVPTANSAMDDF